MNSKLINVALAYYIFLSFFLLGWVITTGYIIAGDERWFSRFTFSSICYGIAALLQNNKEVKNDG
jgi:hypothetical protein